MALHATKLQRDIAVIITVQDNFDVSSALLYLKFCRLGVMIIYLIMCWRTSSNLGYRHGLKMIYYISPSRWYRKQIDFMSMHKVLFASKFRWIGSERKIWCAGGHRAVKRSATNLVGCWRSVWGGQIVSSSNELQESFRIDFAQSDVWTDDFFDFVIPSCSLRVTCQGSASQLILIGVAHNSP